jgi:hypothetical protein
MYLTLKASNILTAKKKSDIKIIPTIGFIFSIFGFSFLPIFLTMISYT